MTPNKIKSQLKHLANDFNLNYNSSWFDCMWIPTRLEILSEYIGDCPDPIYVKYGKNPKQRIANIDHFLNSKDFKVCLKRYGGQVASRSELAKEVKWAKQIKNPEVKEELLTFYKKLAKRFNKTPYIALLTIPKSKKEEKWQLTFCLRHEWIHILLSRNNIDFQKAKSKAYWRYDEGINDYLGAYLDKSLNKLEKFREKEKYPMEKQNWIYAIKFRGLLKDCRTSQQRKRILIKFITDLK